jgi:tetratricopeptide (TPR) repeat protein
MDKVADDLQVAISSFERYLAAEGEKTKEDFEDADPDSFRPDQVWVFTAATQIELGGQLPGDQGTSYFRDAISNCDRAIAFEPDSPNAFYQRGVAQRTLGELKEAIDSWDEALEIGSELGPELHLRRGIARYYLGDLRAARQDFEDARTGAYDGRAQFWIGVTYAREGNYLAAIQNYSASLRLNPEYKPAYLNRGNAYMQLADYSRAEKDYNELVLRDSEDMLARQRRDQARQQRQALRVPPSQYYP